MVQNFEILTERTRIVPFVREHIPVILEMLKEPDSNKYIAPMLDRTDEFYLEKLESNVPENEARLQFFSVFTQDSNKFLGTMNLNKFKPTGHDQIGLHLCRDFWNNGYGTECAKAILEFAKNERKMKEIFWVFEPEHDVSKKLALKLGFEPHLETKDEWGEVHIYRKVLKPE